ncbi:replication initiation factor domain-containing protein [Pediococcus siamensis]|uniref:replication initiation factor domain-containing protein n=1 Tax=Pediococcus siamensis TaxID=381829 RepID=UPI0039A06AA7
MISSAIAVHEKAVFKRIDLAVNDTDGMLDIPELVRKCEHTECISIMRQFESTDSGKMNTEDSKMIKGSILHIGSCSSEIYFYFYKKCGTKQKEWC